jgi:integrase/recombinase XerD
MLARHARLAGIQGRCSPHVFRHTAARSFLVNGGSSFALQRLLGHSSIVVTQVYVNLLDKDIQLEHSRCSPVDNLPLRLR